jgi:hypothetical protein
LHEWNTIAHLNDYEGNPEARPFTGPSCSDSWIMPTTRWNEQCERSGKGRAAYRDATLFKVIYAWGLFSRGHEVRRTFDLAFVELSGGC